MNARAISGVERLRASNYTPRHLRFVRNHCEFKTIFSYFKCCWLWFFSSDVWGDFYCSVSSIVLTLCILTVLKECNSEFQYSRLNTYKIEGAWWRCFHFLSYFGVETHYFYLKLSKQFLSEYRENDFLHYLSIYSITSRPGKPRLSI